MTTMKFYICDGLDFCHFRKDGKKNEFCFNEENGCKHTSNKEHCRYKGTHGPFKEYVEMVNGEETHFLFELDRDETISFEDRMRKKLEEEARMRL